ncbi:MAG: hypothetical protein M0R74_05215 [Dehalococcoidia bacterium]|nr:hypothetical protein [Dehalococcoidia bacterium]
MTTPPVEAERVRSYLITQAAKLTLRELVEKVRKDTLPLADVAGAIPAARFAEMPGDGEWSAAQVWNHILTMNKDGARAIESIIESGAAPALAADVIGSSIEGTPATGPECYRVMPNGAPHCLTGSFAPMATNTSTSPWTIPGSAT